jgi:hypothetical protein
MMLKVFIISVGIAFFIEIVHSILTKGGRFTLEFFGGGFLFGFVREFIYFSFVRTYEFPDMPIKLLNVPIFIPIGWIFTFYLAYEFTSRLIEPKIEKDYKDFIIFSALFSTCICIPIETAAMNMNWWLLKFYVNDNIAPFNLMGGWGSASFMFFYIYFVMKGKILREQLMFIVFVLIVTFTYEFNLVADWGLAGLLLRIIGLWGMFKYNKEITLISLIFLIICLYSREILSIIPNGILVTIMFTAMFFYILVKLRYMYVSNQLRLEKSL